MTIIESVYDATSLVTRTGHHEKITVLAKIAATRPELVQYMEELKYRVDNPDLPQLTWVEHEATVIPGRHVGVLTDNGSNAISFNNGGVLETKRFVDIYMPLTTADGVITRIFCFGPNSVRLLGHFNGVEAEVLVIEPGVVIEVVSNALLGTNKIIQPTSTASTTFTAEIYEDTPNTVIPFTAEIYDDVTTFTAEIYEGA